jgi:hypothetical protein
MQSDITPLFPGKAHITALATFVSVMATLPPGGASPEAESPEEKI